jgi:Cu-Zn family superoxide dismutase
MLDVSSRTGAENMMRKIIIVSAALAAVTANAATPPSHVLGTATILASDGTPRGEATLVESGDVVTLTVKGAGLPPGAHGAHLHAVGKCDAPAFTSAGPHLNPMGKMHGMMNPQGSHLGDLPNLTVADDGTGTLAFRIDGSPAMLEHAIFDTDGTAIVIHAAADDYKTDPSGNSGSRIACGVFVRPANPAQAE